MTVANRLWFRLALLLFGMHALLLPILVSGLLVIFDHEVKDALVNEVRTYGRLLADELELGDALNSPARTLTLLDSVILSGRGVYADIVDGDTIIRSSLIAPGLHYPPSDDLRFGARNDNTYFFSIPIARADRRVILRLGFDESGSAERILRVRRQVLLAVLLFLATSIGLGIWLATRVAEPLTRLQNAARRISQGDVTSRLTASSRIQEVRELAEHLEFMRSELVGTNARLAHEMKEHAAAETQRRELAGRLRQQERIASLGTLAGGIAHEFNNILTPILLYTRSAQDELAEGSPAVQDLQQVISAARRARQLVTRILTFGHEIRGGPDVPMQIDRVAEEVLALVQVVAPANVEIVSQLSADLPSVRGDPDLTNQLIMNLCTNAYQAMLDSGGVLRVRVAAKSVSADPHVPSGDYVVLEVSDTGRGMDDATRARIFEPFFTTRDIGEGTGLGLSVVHGIAAGMGATITVDSELGRGSTFRVYFPVTSVPEQPAALPDPDQFSRTTS